MTELSTVGVRPDVITLDLSAGASGHRWVGAVEQTSRWLLDEVGRRLRSASGSLVVAIKLDSTPTPLHAAAHAAATGIIGVAALEQARNGRRINAVAYNDGSARDDVDAAIEFLSDDAAAAYCTGATIDLTHTPSAEAHFEATRPVLVTGASGGLGRAAAEALIEQGYRVILSDLGSRMLDEAAEALGAEAIACNVTDPDAVARLADDPRLSDGLSGLAVYHGVGGGGLIGQMDPGVRDRSLVINGTGVYNVVSALVPALQRGRGAVVVLASQSGLIAEIGNGAYCASKFAAVGYVRALAHDLASTGVRAHAICPGPVDTPLMRTAFAGMAAAEGKTFDEYWQSRLDQIPLRRFGRAEQIASAAPLLIALRATGVVLSATGGVVPT